ncbi:unnamed protein product [Clonostachys byssicola]|uniref:Heterokaryon incompatibility domain-containing protein n=1 Tax=Clonostachys byssicola TaxID=160290 RepID=A0A9N9U9L8_9HYPO|nr:unnamed protein product [Clonostachys byssicola]
MDSKSQAQKYIEEFARERQAEKKTRNVQDLERSVQKFANELYRSETHFLLELLQNADDNRYTKTSRPSFSIEYRERGLRIDCNEDGFTEENVEAICSVGNSTKTTSSPGHKYIGEKGIGFKSVFRVATKVWIYSGGYKFALDRTKPLGIITPTWEDFPETPPEGGTAMYFQLSNDCDEKLFWDQIQVLDANALIFLSRLRQLKLVIPKAGRLHERRLCREDNRIHSQAIESKIFENDQQILHYLICQYTAQDMPKEEKRPDCRTSDIMLAFPKLDDSNPRTRSQMMYAFLPIRDCGFKFLIQADFLLAASREDIDESSPWNQKILACLPDALGSAIEYLNNTELRFTWPRYLPRQDEVQKDYRTVSRSIVSGLSKRDVLESESGQLRAPLTLTYIPKEYTLENGEPLSLSNVSSNRYLSRKYGHGDKQNFQLIGVKALTFHDFVRDLHESIREQAAKDRPPEWHSHLAMVLVKNLIARDVRHSAVSKIPIIPLRNGTWVTADESWDRLFFPAEEASTSVPEDTGLMEVHPSTVEDPFRFQLFQLFGAKPYSAVQICQAIAKMHKSSAPPVVTAKTLISQTIFLFLQSWICPKDIDLWVATDQEKFHRASEVYMRPLEIGKKTFPALHPDYLAAMAERQDEWIKWLLQELHISTIPRFVVSVGKHHFELSPEMELIRNHWSSADFLTLLRDNWDIYSGWLEANNHCSWPQAWESSRIKLQKQIASFEVQCKGTQSLYPLDQTVLPTVLQDEAENVTTYFRVIDIPDPGEPSWAFLEKFGVIAQPNATLFLQGLETAKKMACAAEWVWFYEKIQIYASQEKATVKKAFSGNPLIFIPESPLRAAQWLRPDNCIWSSSSFFKRTATLAGNYPSCRGLFQDILGVQDADLQTTLTELFSTSKSDGLDYFVKLFAYLNRHSSASIRALVTKNADKFKTKLVFPIDTKGERPAVHHLGSISAESIWYIADRPHLREKFRGRIPLLAFDNDQLEKMKWIYLLPSMTKRSLSNLVVCKPLPGLKSTLHERLTNLLRDRAKHIILLVPGAAVRQKAVYELESVTVYSAEKVSVQWELIGPSGLVATSLPDVSNAASALVEGQLRIYLSRMVINADSVSLELSRTLATRYEIHQKHSLTLCGTLSWTDAEVEDQLKRDGISHDQDVTSFDVFEEPTVLSDEFSGWPPKPETWFTWVFKSTSAGITQLRSLLYAARLLFFTRDTAVFAVLGIGIFTIIWKLDPALGFLRSQLDGWLLKKKADKHPVLGTTDGHTVPQTLPPKSSRYWYPTWAHTGPQETSPSNGPYRTPPPPDYGPIRTSVPSSKPTAKSSTHGKVLGNAFLAQYLSVEMLPDKKVFLILLLAVVLLLLAWFSEPSTSDQLPPMDKNPNVIDPAFHQSDEESEAEEWQEGTIEIAEKEGGWESDSAEDNLPNGETRPEKDTPKLESKEGIQATLLSLDSGRNFSSPELDLQSQITNQNSSASITQETRRLESDKGSVIRTYTKIIVAPSPSRKWSSVEISGHPPASPNPEGVSEAGNKALTSETIGVDYAATDTLMSTPMEADLQPSQTSEEQQLTTGDNRTGSISSASSTKSILDESMLRKTSSVEAGETEANNILATGESPNKEHTQTRNEHHEPTPGGVTISGPLQDQNKDNIELAIRQPVSSPSMIEDQQSGMETPVLLEDVPLKRLDEESTSAEFFTPDGQIGRSEALEYSPISSWNTASGLPSIPMGLHSFGGGGILAPGDRAMTSEFVDHFISQQDDSEFVNTSTGVMYNPSPTTMFVGEDTDEARFLGELYVSQHLRLLLGPDIYQPEVNWTSSARSRNGHKPFVDKELDHSTFTLTEKLGMGKARNPVSRAFKLSDLGLETCRFHIQVCVTAGGLQSPFRLSNAQCTKCRDMTLRGQERPTNVYILARVYHIHTNPQIAFYTDPWQLYQKGLIALESSSAFRGTVSKAAPAVIVETPKGAATASEMQRIYSKRLNPDEIRLLKLENSTDPSSPLVVSLIVKPTKKTDESLRYWAISYVWGSAPTPLSPFQLVIDGVKIPVTESLWTCLCRLRSEDITDYIWADAICINQTDNLEKAMQVRQMGRIYSKADRVIIWMGGNQDRDCNAINILKKLRDTRESQKPRQSEQLSLTEKDKEQVWAFLQRPWFTRTWTIQELVLGNRVSILYRDAEMEWDDFMGSVLFFEEKILLTKDGNRELYATPSDPARALDHIRQTWQGRSLEAGGSRLKLPILRLVEMFFYAQASMPRDKLFAMHSMASDTSYEIDGFSRPDYESDDSTILARYGTEFVERNKVLELLSRAGRDKGSTFSSWIPDMMNHARRPQYGPTISTWKAVGTVNNFRFSAGASQSPNPTVPHLGSYPFLAITGKMFDSIQSERSLKIGDDVTAISFVQILEELRQLLSDLSSYPNLSQNKRWRDHVLIQTLIGDAIGPQWGTSRSVLIDDSLEDEEVLERWPLGFEQEILSIRSGRDSHQYRSKPAEVQQKVNDYWRTAAAFLGKIPNPALCVTTKGYVGVVPGGTRQKDKVLLVHGARVPFVVRQQPGTDHYELIGECYIHGVMYYDDAVAGKVMDERVILV